MNDDIANTIEVLTARVSAKEGETNKLKKLVNELCVEAGKPIRYPNIAEEGAALASIRSDQFYGQSLTAAIRNYLERRKAANLGAASLAEIFKAIKEGGYKFETASEENAKIGVSNALRKTSSIFHRLPNGHYGLLIWYPNAKATPIAVTASKAKPKQENTSQVQAEADETPKGDENAITNKEIRDVILAQPGEFRTSDIAMAVKAKYPSKDIPNTKISTVIFILKKKGLVNELEAKSGQRGAVYSKV